MTPNDEPAGAEGDMLFDLIGQIALGMWAELATMERALESAEKNQNSTSEVEKDYARIWASHETLGRLWSIVYTISVVYNSSAIIEVASAALRSLTSDQHISVSVILNKSREIRRRVQELRARAT
jgi:hypothetical protein